MTKSYKILVPERRTVLEKFMRQNKSEFNGNKEKF